MSKIDTTVGQLVDMIKRGELRLPEMQRKYVWTSTRVRDLIDSLYRGYPSGTILVWETDAEHHARDLAVGQDATPFSSFKLLLDGQQRLTSLSAVLRGEPVQVRNRKRPIQIAFNLNHPEGGPLDVEDIEDDLEKPTDENNDVPDEETIEEENASSSVYDRIDLRNFSVASKPLLGRPNWIDVSDVFKGGKSDWAILKDLVESPDDPKYAMYSERLQRLKKIRDYPYVMQVVGRDLSYGEVTEIFVRVNSLGMKLRGSDLALAQITAKWQNSLPIFEEFVEECEDNAFTIDTGLLVRLMVVFSTKQSRFNTVARIPLSALKDSWAKTKAGVRFAINFLRANAGIEDSKLLASPFFLIPIAVFGILRDEKITPEDEQFILRWLYAAHAKGHYSGSSETRLDADLSIIFKGSSFDALSKILEQKYTRLHIEPDDLKHKSIRSPLFLLAYLALKYGGAKDWKTGLGLSLTHQGNLHYIEYHPMFPKSILRKAGYEKAEINAISNMAFISGRMNRNISNKRPVDYFPKIIDDRGDEALKSQCIPLDQSLWKVDNYRSFLEHRRTALAKAINAFVDSACANGKATDITL